MKYFIATAKSARYKSQVQVVIEDELDSLLVFHGHTEFYRFRHFSGDDRYHIQEVSMVQAMLRVGKLTYLDGYYRKRVREFISRGENNEGIRKFHDVKRVLREYSGVDLGAISRLMYPFTVNSED